MINRTQLNTLKYQIDKNKVFLDNLALKEYDDKKSRLSLSMSSLMEYFNHRKLSLD